MRYGYWLPVFGGWLRNVENENMEVSWAYVKKLAQRSEQIGFDLTLIAELNLNDIKGVEFEQHDDRYARTSEWLDVVDGVWKQDHFSFSGKYYRVEDNVLEPKPVAKPRPTLYAG